MPTILRLSLSNLQHVEATITGFPLWCVLAAPLLMLLFLRVVIAPYARLLHPSARATRHRIACARLLAFFLCLLSMFTAWVLSRECIWAYRNVRYPEAVNWVLVGTLAFPLLAHLLVQLLCTVRLLRLRIQAKPHQDLDSDLRQILEETADLLELPRSRIPRVVRPGEGPPGPYVYGFDLGPPVLVYPLPLDLALAAVAAGDESLRTALQRFFVGHELGHVVNGEIGFLCFWGQLYPLLRWWPPALLTVYLLAWSLAPLPCHWTLIPSLPLLVITTWIVNFLAITAGREREFAADAAGLYSVPSARMRSLLSAVSRGDESVLQRVFNTLIFLQKHSAPINLVGSNLGWSLGALSRNDEPVSAAVDWKGWRVQLASRIASNWTRTHPPMTDRQSFWGGPAVWHSSSSTLRRLLSVFLTQAVASLAISSALIQIRHLLNVLWLETQSSLWFAPADSVAVDRAFYAALLPTGGYLFAITFISCYEGNAFAPERDREKATWLGLALVIIGLPILAVTIVALIGPQYLCARAVESYCIAYGLDMILSRELFITSVVQGAMFQFAAIIASVLYGSASGLHLLSTCHPWIERADVRRGLALVSLLCGPLLIWATAEVISRGVTSNWGSLLTVAVETLLLTVWAWWVAARLSTWMRLWRRIWPGGAI